jgi:hypothetical protein
MAGRSMPAYLEKHGYLHDIFISYSHGDTDQAGNSLLKDWSVQFVDLLNKNLSTVLQQPVSIFLDDSKRHELDRLAAVTGQFKGKIEKSALLQVLMSPHYLEHVWCVKELELWAASQPAKVGSPDRRIAVARIIPTDYKKWPQTLKDATGEPLPVWWFHPKDSYFPHGWSLFWNGRAPNEVFSEAMINLAGTLKRRLVELDEELILQERQRDQIAALQVSAQPRLLPQERREAEALSKKLRNRIFVSHAAQNRKPALEIVRELELQGIDCWVAPRNVRPGKPFDDEIVEAIESCRAMVLVFSEFCNDSDYIRREVTLAGEARKLIIPLRIEDVQPRKGLRVRLADLHWIDAFVAREEAISILVAALKTDEDHDS